MAQKVLGVYVFGVRFKMAKSPICPAIAQS